MSFRIGANFSFFLIFLVRRLSSLREQWHRRRRLILRFAMLNRKKIRRQQQISLLPALIMATTEEIMPRNVEHVRRFWTIPRNQLWFETKQVAYFEVTSRIHYLITFTRLTDLALFVCVAYSKRGIDLAWSTRRPVWTFKHASGADALSKIRARTESIYPMHKWRQFKYSFVCIQISPTSLILGNIFFWKFNSRTRLVGLISM